MSFQLCVPPVALRFRVEVISDDEDDLQLEMDDVVVYNDKDDADEDTAGTDDPDYLPPGVCPAVDGVESNPVWKLCGYGKAGKKRRNGRPAKDFSVYDIDLKVFNGDYELLPQRSESMLALLF